MNTRGFAVIPEVLAHFDAVERDARLSQTVLPRSRAGMRQVLRDSTIAILDRDSRLLCIAEDVFEDSAIPFRATYFVESPEWNRLVV